MTRRAPFTQASAQKAIKAALASGLRVTGIRPDGTVLTESREQAPAADLTAEPRPRDAREKFGAR